jgi:hypothetical protein
MQPSAPLGYEFDPNQNRIIDRLARRMRVTGIVQIVLGVLFLLGFIGRTLALRQGNLALTIGVDVPVALAFIVGGALMVKAATPFLEVVKTAGNDIDHIMSACVKLSRVMTTLIVAVGVATVVWLAVFTVLAVTGTPVVEIVDPTAV